MERSRRLPWPGAIYAVACLGVALALGLASYSIYYAYQQHSNAVQVRANGLKTALQLRLSLIENQLTGVAGFLSAVRHVDASTYAGFMRRTVHQELGQTLRAIAFLPAMSRGDAALVQGYLDAHAASFAAEGYPPFAIFPEAGGKTDDLFPVLLVEPATARKGVFGYDLASSPERLSRARRAITTGQVTLTDPLTLSQDSDGAPVSMLLIAPVELDPRAVAHTGLPAERGVVAVGVTPVKILEELLRAPEAPALRADIRIGTEAHPGLRLDRMEAGGAAQDGFFRQEVRAQPLTIAFGGRMLWLDYAEIASLSAREIANAAALFLLSLMAAGLAVAYQWRQAQVAGEIETRLAAQEEELRQTGRMMARVQKQEALGNLVGGVAHDFNNLLAVILGNAEFLDEPVSRQERDECVRQIKLATERGGSLSRQLLSFGRRAILEPERHDLVEFIADIEAMLRRVLPASITLRCRVSPGTSPVFIDRSQLDTAVLNLAINARDAMPGGGCLSIEARNVMLCEDFVWECDEDLMPGPYVMLSVRDTGKGMPPDMAARAFDPFFTTKPVGQGSGLGLSMVMGFVRQSGGTLRLQSEPGRGTTVSLYLQALAPAAAAADATPEPPGREVPLHVLICEDEAPVRQVLQRQLASAGHRVSCAENGEAAMRMLREGARPDILLSDIVMPGSVQGPDLVAAARQMAPGLGTILISGYPRDAEEAAKAVSSDTVVLQKPVRKRDLLAAIATLAQTGETAAAEAAAEAAE